MTVYGLKTGIQNRVGDKDRNLNQQRHNLHYTGVDDEGPNQQRHCSKVAKTVAQINSDMTVKE